MYWVTPDPYNDFLLNYIQDLGVSVVCQEFHSVLVTENHSVSLKNHVTEN